MLVKSLRHRSGLVGRKVDVDDLVGAAEIADRLDIAHAETIHAWRQRHRTSPKPMSSYEPRRHVVVARRRALGEGDRAAAVVTQG